MQINSTISTLVALVIISIGCSDVSDNGSKAEQVKRSKSVGGELSEGVKSSTEAQKRVQSSAPKAVDAKASQVATKPGGPVPPEKTPLPLGLSLELSDGANLNSKATTVVRAKAEQLDSKSTQDVVNRLPALVKRAEDVKSFAFRKRTMPAPRAGKTVKSPFPPIKPKSVNKPVASEAKEFTVLRYQPEGDVPLARTLSVTFDQPMVALTSHSELSAADVPAKLTPEIEGQWRWVGTKTLFFEPKTRFPMATRYQVEIPAGIQSAVGGRLKKAKKWSFSTPAPQVTRKHPTSSPVRLDPVLFVHFDQKIDSSDVLKTIVLRAGGSARKLRMATAAEIEADSVVKELVKTAKKGRWLAFMPVDKLPPDTSVAVSVGPGTPSAEGSRKTKELQSFSFRTYAPFKFVSSRCGWRNKCPPMSTWTIRFNNSIDSKAFKDSMVTVTPAVPGLAVTVWSNRLNISGRTKGRTTYKVTVSKQLKDAFGQVLGAPAEATFDVGDAEPRLWSQGGTFVTLDPSGKPTYPIYTINHKTVKLRLYKVEPKHWSEFKGALRGRSRYGEELKLPGQLVTETTVDISDRPDELVESAIDVSSALSNGLGQVILDVEPLIQPKDKWRRTRVLVWIQSTRMGLDAFIDNEELVAWATALDTGKPLPDVSINMLGRKGKRTGDNGLATIPLPASSETKLDTVLIARLGKDLAMIPESNSSWGSTSYWYARPLSDFLRWYVFDDRKMYKPGEEVTVKGWIRKFSGAKAGDIGLLDGTVKTVSWVVKDSRRNQVANGKTQLGELGGFDFKFKLPDNLNLGRAQISLSAVGGSGGVSHTTTRHSFSVQEFRRPEFEVSTKVSQGPHIVGGTATVSLHAKYFAGGGLANTAVNWSIKQSSSSYSPPNTAGFSFGTWVPWWSRRNTQGQPKRQSFSGRTDGKGVHHLRLKFNGVNPPSPTSISAVGTVQDVNRQTWTSTATVLVHPSSHYVGISAKRAFVEAGNPIEANFIVSDLDGKRQVGRAIKVTAERLVWEKIKGSWRWEQVVKETNHCSVDSSDKPVTCTFETKEGGQYRIKAQIMDEEGRANESQRTFWVSGGKRPTVKKITQEKVTLIPSQKNYQPGQTAEILVQSPYTSSEGLMTLTFQGLLKTQRFTMNSTSHTLKIPIEERYIPGVKVRVDLVGATKRVGADGELSNTLPLRPAFASGSLQLSVPATERALTVSVTPKEKRLDPGSSTEVKVSVLNAQGEPVSNAEVALVVVDEAILALSGARWYDPMGTFYGARDYSLTSRHSRTSILLTDPEKLKIPEAEMPAVQSVMNKDMMEEEGAEMPAPSPSLKAMKKRSRKGGGGGRAPGGAPKAIAVRSNFSALAHFSPSLSTDASGITVAKFKVPDSLTRYRVIAVAVSGGKRFGLAESNITARLPLMVRASPPRFLNFGDEFELPVVLQNQTDQSMSVDVAVRAVGFRLTQGAGRRIEVPANNRVEVRFPSAVAHVGTGRFQIGAVSGKRADASTHAIPIWTPATTEAFATYGTLDKGALRQPIKAPADVVPEFGGLEITTSSTALHALTDAVMYLVSYPYDCVEQISSRVMAVAALKDVLSAFKAKGLPSKGAMLKSVARDLKRLQRLQNYDGGWGFWRAGVRSWPYLTVHVAHALQRAKQKGFSVPQRMFNRAKSYLKSIERKYPSYYSPEIRRTITAYALYVRNLMGDADVNRAQKLLAEDGGLKNRRLETVGWLLSVVSKAPEAKKARDSIRKHLNNRVTETAAGAHFVDQWSDGAHVILHSNRRADGVILDALIEDSPKSDLIVKVVRGLMAHKKKGRWYNTQENAFVLLAMDRYFSVFEKKTPNFVASAWLGKNYAGEHRFKGRTTERHHIDIPMKMVALGEPEKDLLLSKRGPGRMYYRLGMRYAPASLKLDAADHGFVVERNYQSVDDAADVKRNEDGTWTIKAGARVRVNLTMVAPTRRYHVALVDPLPAGLEPLNPALKGTDTAPSQANKRSGNRSRRSWRWWRTWFEHQNLRDERAEAFTSSLWGGVHTWSYVARATTPGNFVVPPTKAEEMYNPETFGRSSSDRVIVR